MKRMGMFRCWSISHFTQAVVGSSLPLSSHMFPSFHTDSYWFAHNIHNSNTGCLARPGRPVSSASCPKSSPRTCRCSHFLPASSWAPLGTRDTHRYTRDISGHQKISFKSSFKSTTRSEWRDGLWKNKGMTKSGKGMDQSEESLKNTGHCRQYQSAG